MLWLERRVVTALAGPDDERTGGAISGFVGSTLSAMPEHLRLGVIVESIGLGAWVFVRYAGRPSDRQVRDALASFERNPIGLVQLYPRLLQSLILFAQQETIAP